MATIAKNVSVNSGLTHNCHELLTWLNETLQERFTKVEHVCTGAAYCQLMDRLFPGSLDLSSVRFQSNYTVDSAHNYNLLQGAFRKVRVHRHIPVDLLMKRNFNVALSFLQWFKIFFDVNNNGRKYHALEARGGQSMSVVLADSDGLSPQTTQELEIIKKMDGKTLEDKQKENLNGNVDAIILISHDDENPVVDVTVKQKEVSAKKGSKGNSLYNCDTLSRFVRKYCCDTNSVSSLSVSTTLGPSHPEDIIQVCSDTPYCLYLYMKVELDGGQSTSVVLIGYFNQKSGVRVVRPLLTLQTSADAVDPQTSTDTDASDSDARLLIKSLEQSGLCLSNLVVFYCDAPHPRGSRAFVSQLQVHSPRLVSLCGLPEMAGRAYQAGLEASFGSVVDLVRDIYHHYSTCPSVHDSLKVLFAGAESYNSSLSLSAQNLFIVRIVHKMVNSWRDLLEYFKSLKSQEEYVSRIRTQLRDYKVKLHFLFLAHALEPLYSLQELQWYEAADVSVELQLTSMLIQSYASNILLPPVAELFINKRDLRVLQDKRSLLPMDDVNVGSDASDFLWATAVVDLGERERSDFKKAVAAFYKAALRCLVQSLPEQLGDVALGNITTVLKHPGNICDDETTQHVLSELAAQLGVCNTATPETHQMGKSFLRLVKTLKEKQKNGAADGHCWGKVLCSVRESSTLHRLLLTLLALPSSLYRTQVFDKVLNCTKTFSDSDDSPVSSPQPRRKPQRPRVRRKNYPVKRRHDDTKKKDAQEKSLDNISVDSHRRRSHSNIRDDDEDTNCTDKLSDVVDVTEESRSESRLMNTHSGGFLKKGSSSVIDNSDDDDDDVDSTITSSDSVTQEGELVWGKRQGFSRWPAVVVHGAGENQSPEKTTVQWYGMKMFSQVRSDTLAPFSNFQHFCARSFVTLDSYHEAIFSSLEEAGRRCHKHFPVRVRGREELLKQMLSWALGGFRPTGPDGLKPHQNKSNGVTKTSKAKKKLVLEGSSSPPSSAHVHSKRENLNTVKEVSVCLSRLTWNVTEVLKEKESKGEPAPVTQEKEEWEGEETRLSKWGKGKSRGGWKGGKSQSKKSDSFHDTSPDFIPYKKKTLTKTHNKVNGESREYKQPDQKLRNETIRRIMDMKLDIEGFCLCCGTEAVETFHPLFKGSLCLKCKDNFTETLYRYDEDGYQSYCTICCYGLEVILCGNDSCCRSYCKDCLNILVGPGTFDSLTQLDPWICYLCQPHQTHGALIPREDWSIRVQELFANNSSVMAFEPHRVYPSIPANLRRPIRVLSLFDGIATGYLVLKELGFKVETYVASEVCEDSIAVAKVNHEGKIIHIGDVRLITQHHLQQWGPFDLLIGGSPCNDLSIVNPIRKGLYEGTGRLFFEFYRILELLKPPEDDPQPFFWLFENVVFMNTHDKVNICRFLECNPVLVDAVKVSPAHRARYFWGNIPAMSRPIIASQNDKLSLQDCLEIHREARVTKVRTITTNPNSLKQGKDVSLLPVLQDGKEDILWVTELEKIFGFPKHYTDVRNMNRQQRQKVLGKAWSVPVIRHLLAPLKDYFACEELLTSSASSSTFTAATSLSSPVSPEVQQLR